MEQLALHVANKPRELGGIAQEIPGCVELTDSFRERAEHDFEIPGSPVVVGLVRHAADWSGENDGTGGDAGRASRPRRRGEN